MTQESIETGYVLGGYRLTTGLTDCILLTRQFAGGPPPMRCIWKGLYCCGTEYGKEFAVATGRNANVAGTCPEVRLTAGRIRGGRK
ncbi:MAG: hypothetical protein KAV87_54905 [Desulfobacteraceae bacterium]|nr:hypothetical protein [Desulfobacteraceae bacterium]